MKGGYSLPKVNKTVFKQLITVRGLNNKTLAEKIAVSPCTISNIMNGRTNPCYEVLNGCLHQLDLSEEEFIACFFKRDGAEDAETALN